MFLLVVSSTIDFQIDRLSPQERQIWRRMEPAIVTILQGGKALGPAALIDRSGLFVAHRSAVTGEQVSARMSDGHTVQLKVCGGDDLTQLVLLQAAKWEPSKAQPFTAPVVSSRPNNGMLLAVLASGPIRAELVAGGRYGVMKPSRRLVPLSEFRFEAPAEEVGTALVFAESGRLLGALSATLSASDANVGPRGGAGNLLDTSDRVVFSNQKYGPSRLTVAYTAGEQVMKRVLDGFRSESHQVIYPTLGVMCVDSIDGGAIVNQVVKGSPAAEVGFRIGDIILDIGGHQIRNQVDFARVMLDQEVGQKVTIRIKRGPRVLLVEPTVAKSSD
jgi:S1-C subfamily serine protease